MAQKFEVKNIAIFNRLELSFRAKISENNFAMRTSTCQALNVPSPPRFYWHAGWANKYPTFLDQNPPSNWNLWHFFFLSDLNYLLQFASGHPVVRFSNMQNYDILPTCILQGEWFLSGKSNLILTERKHAINFNLKVDSDQGRLGIWYSTTKIQKNILQHPQNLCQNHNTHYIKLKKMVISK